MTYGRIKKISEEERAARAQLKKMGVSEYELQRLYDANYKARKRAEFAGAEYGESLNLNWKNILRGARQAQARGGSASEYIQERRASFKGKYTIQETKINTIQSIAGEDVSGDWGAELVSKVLKRYSAQQVLEKKVNAIEKMQAAGEALPPPTNEAYRRAHGRYIAENASTQAEWDNILNEERAKELEENERLLEYIGKNLGVDLDGVRAAQAEADAAGLSDSEYQKAKRKAFREYAGV